VRPDGFVPLQDAIKYLKRERKLPADLGPIACAAVLRDIVADCPKQRFQLSEAGDAVRAVQGHSLPHVRDDLLLEPFVRAEDLPQAIHGTYAEHLPSIRVKGLHKGRRNHIHMTTDMPGASGVLSGARASADVFLYIDVPRAMAAGIQFFRAANGVVLSEGLDGVIPFDCISRVVHKA